MATIANLNVKLQADASDLIAGTGKGANAVVRSSNRMSKAVDSSGKQMRTSYSRTAKSVQTRSTIMAGAMAGAAAGAVASGISIALSSIKKMVAGTIQTVKRTMSEIDKLAKNSRKLGIGTEELIGLRHAGELTGVKIESMDVAIQRMVRRLSQAAKYGGATSKALDELGLSAKDLVSAGPLKSMLMISDAMQGIGSQADRVRLAFALFDTEGVNLVNTLGDGSGALQAMIDDAERLGLTIPASVTSKIEAATDATNRMQKAMKGGANSMTVFLAPAIRDMSNILTDLIVDFNGMGDAGENSFEKIAKSGEKMAFSMKMSITAATLWINMLKDKLTGADSLETAMQAILSVSKHMSDYGKAINSDPEKGAEASPAALTGTPSFSFQGAFQRGTAGALSAITTVQENETKRLMQRQLTILEQIDDNTAETAINTGETIEL